jgi:hypothetical protein
MLHGSIGVTNSTWRALNSRPVVPYFLTKIPNGLRARRIIANLKKSLLLRLGKKIGRNFSASTAERPGSASRSRLQTSNGSGIEAEQLSFFFDRLPGLEGPADSWSVPSGGIAEALGSRKLDREPPGTERCRRKPDGNLESAVSGLALRQSRPCPEPLDPGNEKIARWKRRVYALGRLGAKTEIPKKPPWVTRRR